MKTISMLLLALAPALLFAQDAVVKTDYGFIVKSGDGESQTFVKTDYGYAVTTSRGQTRTLIKTDYGYMVSGNSDTSVRAVFHHTPTRKKR